jgi:hypothetical protein
MKRHSPVPQAEEPGNWIVATHQAWKLYITLAGFGGALICFTLGFFSLAYGRERFYALIASGFFLGVATFFWFTVAIRCPRCESKLVWKMAMGRPHSSWVIDLAALEECPDCGADLRTGDIPGEQG